MCPYFVIVGGLSIGDNFGFSLLIGGFCLFKDIDQMLGGTDCLAGFIDDSYRFNKSCHIYG